MTQNGTGPPKYFIAIDFGTHGSGFAYASAADSDLAVKTFEYWPGQRGSPSPKTRTTLLYKRADLAKPQAWGWEALSIYGDLPEDEKSNFLLLESFKLYLMPDDFQGLPQLPVGLSVRKLVGDYLGCLLALINSTMDAHYGSRYRPSDVRWCLTIPAGLPQRSMTLMREAAMDAGIIPSLQSSSLHLATEPEAAALTAQQRKDLMGLSTGATFMVIDMGGGTVDMTIHKVDAVVGEDMTLTEVTHRECLPEGATRVDKRFIEHLSESLEAEAYKDWHQDVRNAEDLQNFIHNQWETCKCAFDVTSNSSVIQVNLPASLVWSVSDEVRARLDASGYGDRFVMSKAAMMSFFKPSLDAVVASALQMLARAGGADIIVLVGGFSGSKHAMKTLRAALEVPGRPVVTPMYSRTAVLEGGVWFARYPSSIVARCSNMTYGVKSAVPWTAEAPSQTWLPHKQAYRCLEGFRRYVAKDELVKTNSVISHTFVPLYPDQTKVVFDIYGCLKKDPRWVTEDTMVKIATVHIDIPAGAYKNPDYYHLAVHFSFGDAQIAVRCVDEQTGKDRRTVLMFDSSEISKEHLVMAMAAA